MKKKNLLVVFILLLCTLCLFFTACDNGNEPDATKQLNTPFVSISDDGLASWTEVENASGYTYKINGGEEKNTSSLSVQLADGQSIQVKAVGDGTNYTDSTYSSSQTYTATQQPVTPTALAAPVVSIDANGLASWSAVANASGYKYKINGAIELSTNSTSVNLTNGQTIQVKAIGDGTNYTDSEYSVVQTYTAHVVAVALATPVVSIDTNGLATWTTITNASAYMYKIDGGTEYIATSLNIQLTNGQSIQVKAVGDGTNYTDSDYSVSKTYTVSTTQTEAPTYLGIIASNSEPSSSDGLPEIIAPSISLLSLYSYYQYDYRNLNDALIEYYQDADNYLGSSMPTESNYPLYSSAGQTVYIQIWLNNPEQHTILSLKLNGTKYQVGGGLSSFFIEEYGQHFNCVYVAVTIPSGMYVEKTYTVTDIEYISNTYINADGTDEFMNNNDTITIGLPYEATIPTVSDFNLTSPTYNSASAAFTLSDKALVDACGGWIGVAVYDGYNIIKQEVVTVGNNPIQVSGLIENTHYYVYVYLYGDTHDGNGVCAHTIYSYGFMTESVIESDTYKVEGVIAYDDDLDRYLGQITLNATLTSPTAQFIKVEVYDDNYDSPALITTLDTFTGSATITENILNGQSYNVKIYYKDNEYPDGKYIEQSVWVGYLGSVYNYDDEYYSIYDDLVFNLTLGNNDQNYAHVNDFTMYVYNENLPNYWAEIILEYLANPNIIAELEVQAQEKWNLMYDANVSGDYALGDQYYAEYCALNDRKSEFENAVYHLENYFGNNIDTEYWETEKAKGKYTYVLTYDSTASSDIFKVGKVYYVVLNDFYTLADWEDYKYKIVANIDSNDGKGLVENTYTGDFYHTHIFSQFNGLITNDIVIGDNSIDYTLYNQDCYDNSGEYYTANFGYVWKIVATKGYQYSDDYKEVILYEISNVPTFGTNGDEWLAAYIAAVKAGQDVSGLMSQFVGVYNTSYSTNVDLSKLTVYGNWEIHIYTRLYLEDYDDDNLYDYDNSTSYLKTVQIGTPTLTFDGRNAVVQFPDEGNYIVYYNVKDADGNWIAENQQGESWYYMEAVGYQVQAKLESWEEGLTASAWSEWVTFEGERLTVTFNDYDMESCSVSWYASSGVSKWIYTLNNGTEVELLPENCSLMLSNGDVLKVKAIAVDGTDYLDSDWAEFTCTDARTPLATPTDLTLVNDNGSYRLEWTMSNTDNISGYRIYVNGEIAVSLYGYTEGLKGYCDIYKLTAGATYQVQAITEDTENYRNSTLSNGVIA